LLPTVSDRAPIAVHPMPLHLLLLLPFPCAPCSTSFPSTTLFRSDPGLVGRSQLHEQVQSAFFGGEQGRDGLLLHDGGDPTVDELDRKSTRLNSSHDSI